MYTTGIYTIKNKQNGMVYVGQSLNIEKRWSSHKSEKSILRNPNNMLYKDFLKYGIENFQFRIVEKCLPTQLNESEKKWIKKLDTFENGYNLLRGGAKLRSTDEITGKQRAYIKGDITESVYKGKRIICLNDKREFVTITSAAKFYGVDISNVIKVLKGKRNHTNDLVFRYM